MKNNNNILIIEPSIIIFEGITKIIGTLGSGLDITHEYSLHNSIKSSTNNNFDLVLVNPVFFNGNIDNSFFTHFSSSNLIGLISTYSDRDICTQFSGCVFLNDKTETIRNTITKFLTINNEAVSSIDNTLSEREIEILKLLVNGKMNKEIAEELFISIHTVVTHRKNIIKKLGVKSTAAMAIYAVANNIIDLDDSLKSIK